MTDAAELYNQALKAVEQGRTGLAIDRLERVLGREPTDTEAAAVLAQVYRDEGRDADAEALLSAITNQVPDAVDLLVALADVRLHLGATKQAVLALKRTLLIEPANWEALYLLGDAFMDEGHPAEAVKVYRLSLETNPFAPETWYNLAVALTNALAPASERVEAWEAYLTCSKDAPDADEVQREIARLRAAGD